MLITENRSIVGCQATVNFPSSASPANKSPMLRVMSSSSSRLSVRQHTDMVDMLTVIGAKIDELRPKGWWWNQLHTLWWNICTLVNSSYWMVIESRESFWFAPWWKHADDGLCLLLIWAQHWQEGGEWGEKCQIGNKTTCMIVNDGPRVLC